MPDTSPPPTGPEIATRAQELKILHLALMLTLPSMLHPELPALRTLLAINGQTPDDDFPVNLFHHDGGPGKETLSFSARAIFTAATTLRGDIVGKDLLSISMLLGGTRIGDMIQNGGHGGTTVPLLQFARHFRNACAHGDRWEFRNGEPKHAAACRGLTLTADLHGQRATWEIVTPRLYVEYLDDISNHFVPGFAPEPQRETG